MSRLAGYEDCDTDDTTAPVFGDLYPGLQPSTQVRPRDSNLVMYLALTDNELQIVILRGNRKIRNDFSRHDSGKYDENHSNDNDAGSHGNDNNDLMIKRQRR